MPDFNCAADESTLNRDSKGVAETLQRSRVPLLGQHVDATSWEQAERAVLLWAHRRESRYVCFSNAHAVVTAASDAALARAAAGADIALPDGAPVAWMMRRFGATSQVRIAGPDFMWRCCASAAREGLSVYLYGASESTLARLRERLVEAFPTIRISGTFAPPMRALTCVEEAEVVDRINRSGCNILWVALGCPKQEIWMASQRGRIRAVMLGVGAAFDFHAGVHRRAPMWMRRYGLEWLHRVASEPRRLWRRYLVTNSKFVWGSLAQLLKTHRH